MEANGRYDHIEDVLMGLHRGQWFGWSDIKNKVYENLVIDDESKEKPTKKFLEDELKKQQDEFDYKQYQRDRLQEYPSIRELVVALYDESDKASIIEKRNAVKAKYPKPE